MKYNSTYHQSTGTAGRNERNQRRMRKHKDQDELVNWAHGFVYRLSGLDFNKAWFGFFFYAAMVAVFGTALFLITNIKQ